jgi:NAD-dependent deacetylase
LARLERAGRLLCVVTQNIDGLHQMAGHAPERVIEIHGSAHTVRCLDCGTTWPAAIVQTRLATGESVPACEICGGPLRAATILFGESLPRQALRRAFTVAAACDLMLVVGSSLIVNPAAQVPVVAKRAGAHVALVNRTSTPLDTLADVRVSGEAGATLAALTDALLGDE